MCYGPRDPSSFLHHKIGIDYTEMRRIAQVSVLGHSITEMQCILNIILSYQHTKISTFYNVILFIYACCQLRAWFYFLKLCLIIIASKSIIALNQKKQHLVNMIVPNFKVSLSGTLFPGCLKLQES